MHLNWGHFIEYGPQVLLVPSRHFPSILETIGVLNLVECLQGQLAGRCQIQRAVVEAGALTVLAKNHVQLPMQAIFNPPMRTNEAVEINGRGRQAAEVIASLSRRSPVDFPARIDAHHAAQMAPFRQSVE